ncbi:MAG TPA: carbohydrate porin [Thermodesulfobacteriota bacterium]|nr:carbohydrate porin [Thermodesulfobacteriota bacterium]
MMKVLGVIMLAIVLLGPGAAPTMAQTSTQAKGKEAQSPAGTAQSTERPASTAEAKSSPQGPYSGDLWHRSTLTGDWFGVRNDLAAKGVTFDMSLTQVYQGILGGGKDQDWKYGGRGDFTLNADTQKLGLWPGGFLRVEVEGNFTNSVNGLTGALNPVNTNQIFPMPTGDNLNVPNVSFMQFFSPYAGVVLGKLALLTPTSGDMNEFAHGKGDTQFMNGAFSVNPVSLLTIPYSTLGAGLIVLPTKDPHAAVVSFSVLQSNGKASTIDFDDLHSNQLTFAGEARVRTDFFGLTGHQLIGGGYSNKTFTSLDQSLRFFIENRSIEKQDGSWMVYYNFDQYLYEPQKGSDKGVGIFGRLGASDGNPNPMHFFFSIGVGGKAIIPGRPLDQFGVGYYYMVAGHPTFTGLLGTTRSFLRNEYGFEAYYNIAITPWLKLTPDIQVIRPAQKEFVDTEVFIPATKNVGTATVFGLRLQMVF